MLLAVVVWVADLRVVTEGSSGVEMGMEGPTDYLTAYGTVRNALDDERLGSRVQSFSVHSGQIMGNSCHLRIPLFIFQFDYFFGNNLDFNFILGNYHYFLTF